MAEYPKLITVDGGIQVPVHTASEEQYWLGATARRVDDERQAQKKLDAFAAQVEASMAARIEAMSATLSRVGATLSALVTPPPAPAKKVASKKK